MKMPKFEISKLETCKKEAFYYIKEPTPEGHLRIPICKEHSEQVLDQNQVYAYMQGLEFPQQCQESI